MTNAKGHILAKKRSNGVRPAVAVVTSSITPRISVDNYFDTSTATAYLDNWRIEPIYLRKHLPKVLLDVPERGLLKRNAEQLPSQQESSAKMVTGSITKNASWTNSMTSWPIRSLMSYLLYAR
jgi:hypothetical protein